MDKYSIVIPVHNEEDFINQLLNELQCYYNEGHEIIMVDDGSTDDTNLILKTSEIIKLIEVKTNKGKGYALRKGLKKASNKKVVIFDGDMEIKPRQIKDLMVLDRTKNINFVIGHRFENLNPIKSSYEWGNFIFTVFTNILFNIKNKDILCCAKSFFLEDIKQHQIKSNTFDIDAELGIMLGIQLKSKGVTHVFLNYDRRTEIEGKKLKISDGWVILERIIKMLKYL